MRVQRTSTLSKDPNNLTRWLEIHAKALSGNISFGSSMSNQDQSQNMSCWKATGITPGTANTNFTITHGLGYVPLTLLGWDTNNGGVLFRGSVAWTSTTITLQCTTVSAAYNVIFG